MTTYNTGNPVGSTDPKDLYDNAQNLDALVNSTTELSHADRLAVQRKTWHGMEVEFDAAQAERAVEFDAAQAERAVEFDAAQAERAGEFAQFLADSAYQDLGVYGAGIEVTRYNQVFLKDGEFYRAAASLGLPYTTTGLWASESGSFVGVGDAVLRQDLAAPNGSAMVGFQQAGTGAVATTIEAKLRESVSILDFIPVSEHAAIRNRTSTYDCYPAIMAAINSVTFGSGVYAGGPNIFFPPGDYRCNTAIELKKTVKLFGPTNTPNNYGAAVIRFASGINGITVNTSKTINGGVETPSTSGADQSTIEGIALIIAGGGVGNFGIWLRARALIRNVLVSGFSGNGIQIIASAGYGGAIEGNANGFRIEGGRVENCGGHGLYTQGADANAGYVLGLDASYNAGLGIYESSFLGNTYVGCATEVNTLGSYKTDSENGYNVFLGCYSEGGQPASSFVRPTLVLGGLHGAGITGTGVTFISNRISSATFDDGASTSFEPCAITGAAYKFQGSGDASPWYWKKTGTNWEYSFNNLMGTNVPMQLSHDGSRASIAFQLGARFGFGTEQRLITCANAAPTTGTYARGDVFFNASPTAGGFVGWVCTAAGTPGTWKTFGAISA